MKRKNVHVLIAALLCVGMTTHPRAATDEKYTVYSVFIYNFIKYLEWPSGNENIVIAVWNNPTAANALEIMAKAKSSPNRKISVKQASQEAEIMNAQMIFVPANSTSAFLKTVDKLRSKPIVVVTEEADLTEKGAAMSFKKVSDKMRFQINNEILKSSGVKVSGTLDALALK